MFMHLFNIHSGGWSTNEVTTMLINSSYIQCVASHLACFAVLSDASGTSDRETTVRLQLFCVKTCQSTFNACIQIDDDDDDSVILYIGCGILILFLLLTMVILLIFR